jgi:RHS repeat-associated protein
VKFATYERDSTASAQDYAQQRYYSNVTGRFFSPDPARASASLSNPQTWNRYAYVHNDPVNFGDPAGLDECAADYGVPCFSVTDEEHLPGRASGSRSAFGSDNAMLAMDLWGAADPLPVLGGGGGNAAAFVDAKYKAQGSLAVSSLHAPCQQALKDLGVSLAGLANQSLNTTYIDASGYNENDPALSQNFFFGNGNSTNINALGSGEAYVPFDRNGAQLPDMVLRAQFFMDVQNDPYRAQVVLVHELLHIYLKKDDGQLAGFLKLHDSAPSPAITEWLQGDCQRE